LAFKNEAIKVGMGKNWLPVTLSCFSIPILP
jgi:hypothetical protein